MTNPDLNIASFHTDRPAPAATEQGDGDRNIVWSTYGDITGHVSDDIVRRSAKARSRVTKTMARFAGTHLALPE